MSSKLILIIGFILLALISVALTKELMRKHKVNQEIELVKEEIDRLERKNEELAALVDYLNTDSFKEIQARQSLNLQKEGETAVAITDPADPAQAVEDIDRVEVAEEEAQKSKSNIVKWWEYFFRLRE
jgi:cell division protein FtsB